jgi:hypothetical protein
MQAQALFTAALNSAHADWHSKFVPNFELQSSVVRVKFGKNTHCCVLVSKYEQLFFSERAFA